MDINIITVHGLHPVTWAQHQEGEGNVGQMVLDVRLKRPMYIAGGNSKGVALRIRSNPGG